MTKYVGKWVLLVAASLAAPLAAACSIDIEEGPGSCNYQPPGGGGGTPPTYTLQGVIQHEGNESDSGGGVHARIRGYSRLANQNNDRVDADYIEVRCYAYGPTATTMDYDSETNGALVDVHFYSSAHPPIGGSGIVNVQCTHHAEKNGVTYDATSATQIAISNYP
ncbi:hypothetical protein [Tahibacter soli]|jgi:hypothetical protein|uniref:Uncharacterized protein n=1 Tax=Tahibacter soli TaxID=2983605 RepID=A0A9X3YHM1_9GAMM|nr:hypothetical protein [Tahibacter soli]MDC8012564.1 hypothetical protein [Tahibacter soli]